jgi:hypothetical protein
MRAAVYFIVLGYYCTNLCYCLWNIYRTSRSACARLASGQVYSRYRSIRCIAGMSLDVPITGTIPRITAAVHRPCARRADDRFAGITSYHGAPRPAAGRTAGAFRPQHPTKGSGPRSRRRICTATKWIFWLNAARIAKDQERRCRTNSTELQPDVQGQDGIGCHQGREDAIRISSWWRRR